MTPPDESLFDPTIHNIFDLLERWDVRKYRSTGVELEGGH
jgi:hypothetical protein